jgi:intein-encoded DNA endonuclease-like protein
MAVEGSQLPALLARLKTDEELRDKFIAAEKSARREAIKVRARIDELAEANVAALSQIADRGRLAAPDRVNGDGRCRARARSSVLARVGLAC